MGNKKVKRLSVNTMDKLIEHLKKTKETTKPLTYEVGTEKITINVKYQLSFEEMKSLINVVVDNSFVDNKYNECNKMFVLFKAILAYYTNLKFDYSNEDKSVEMLFNTSLFCDITNKINFKQYEYIIECINNEINYIRQSNLHHLQEKYQKLEIELKTKINQEQDTLVNEIANLIVPIQQTFEVYNSDEMRNAYKKLSNMNSDEIAKLAYEIKTDKEKRNLQLVDDENAEE